MRYVLPFAVIASPALAHEGPHLHPHGGEGVVMLLLLAGAAGLAVLALRK